MSSLKIPSRLFLMSMLVLTVMACGEGSIDVAPAEQEHASNGTRQAASAGRLSVSALPEMRVRRIRSRRVPDTSYQYVNCPDGCAHGKPSYLFHLVAEQGPSWYSAISKHPHAQSPAYAPAHVHGGIPGVQGVAVNHYWRGSGKDTVAHLATNAYPATIGKRDRSVHYIFNGIFETSELGGVKPYLRRLWQVFRVRLVKRNSGGAANDGYRVLAGISWTDVAGRRYILEINLASSSHTGGWCRDRVICTAGQHHGSLERYITLGGRALSLPDLSQTDFTPYGIYWGSLIDGLRSMSCDISGLGQVPCLPHYALHFDGNNPKCTFQAGISSETRGYGFTEIAVTDLDLQQQ